MTSADLLSAFMLGVLGSGHCLSMCGGAHSMLLLREQHVTNPNVIASTHENDTTVLFVPLFSAGRLLSYSLAGLMFGSLGYSVQAFGPTVAAIAKLSAGLLLLSIALYIGRWWMVLGHLETLAAKAWQHIQPATSALIPPRSLGSAFALGALWGWIPCGLVYSVLAWSALVGTPESAAVLMLVFGLGTLPAMLTAGFAATKFVEWMNKGIVRHSAALLLLIFAVLTIGGAVRSLLGDESAHAHHFNSRPEHQHHSSHTKRNFFDD